jgi:DNA-binding transcriptional regulator YbjK
VLADAAIRVLATVGLRGLTHRAVDAQAGLPQGSTSFYFRTRQALLAATLDRLAELDHAAFLAHPQAVAVAATDQPADLIQIAKATGELLDPDQLAQVIGEMLAQLLSAARDQLLARYELALEATRRPELREVLQTLGARFRVAAASLLAGAGSPDPERHGRELAVHLDGLLFHQLTTASADDPAAELRLAVRDLLRGMLGR